MPTINATVLGLTANSYVTYAEAETYMGTRLYTEKWDDADQPTREKALLMSARQLDTLVVWNGVKRELLQAMQWPRYSVENPYSGFAETIDWDTIPTVIKHAQMEQALALLAEDLTAESGAKGLRALSVGEISLDFDKSDTKPMLARSVRDLISPYAYTLDGERSSFAQVVRT